MKFSMKTRPPILKRVIANPTVFHCPTNPTPYQWIKPMWVWHRLFSFTLQFMGRKHLVWPSELTCTHTQTHTHISLQHTSIYTHLYTPLMFLIIAAVCGSLWSLSCLSLFFFSLFLSAFWLHFRGKKCTVKWLAVAKQLPEGGSYSCLFTWARSFTLSISDESVWKFEPFHMHLEHTFKCKRECALKSGVERRQNSLDESDAHMLWEAEWNKAVEFY